MRLSPEAERRILEQQHAFCVALRGSQAYSYFLKLVDAKAGIAQRDVCASDTTNREFVAGRLSGLLEAAKLIDNEYLRLKPLVEVEPS